MQVDFFGPMAKYMRFFTGPEPAERTQAADTTAHYTEIVNAHLDQIYNYARYMLSDADDADDVVQHTFLSLYNNLGKLDLSKPVKPWLFRVAHNAALDHIKKSKPVPFSENQHEIAEIPELYHSIEERLDDQMFIEQLESRISALPQQIREVMLLKYFEDFTFEQIAETLDIPVNTAKSNFYRGKTKIFNQLKIDSDRSLTSAFAA